MSSGAKDGTISASGVSSPHMRRAWPVLVTTLLGCLLPAYEPSDGATGGGAAGPATTTSGPTSGAGGAAGAESGGGGQGGGPSPICPDGDFTLPFGNDMSPRTEVHVGVFSPFTGLSIVAGPYEGDFDFVTTTTTPVPMATNWFVGAIGPDGMPAWIVTLHTTNDAGDPGVLDDLRLTPLSDGGTLVTLGAQHLSAESTAGGNFNTMTQADSVDGFAIKLAADGEIAWSISVEGSGIANVFGGVEVPGDRILLFGSYIAEAAIDGTPLVNGGAGNEILAFTVDAGGGLQDVFEYSTTEATLRDAVVRNDEVYLLGEYAGNFPDFGLVSPPGMTTDHDWFLVRLVDLVPQNGWAYGALGRPDRALRILDAGDGLVIAGKSAPGLGTQFSLGSYDTTDKMLDPMNAATIVAKVGYEGEGLGFERNALTAANPSWVRLKSLVPYQGDHAVIHWHEPPDAVTPVATYVQGTPYAVPDVDSLWLRVGGVSGTVDAARPFGAGSAASEITRLALDSSICGDLVFGHYVGAIDFESVIFQAATTRAFAAFRTAQTAFDPP